MRPYTFIVKDNIISIIKFISYQLYSSTTLYPGYRIIFSPRVQPPTWPPRRAELNAPPVAGFLSGRFLWTVFFFVPQSPDCGHNLATRGPAGAPNLPPRSAPVPPCAARSRWCRSDPPIADPVNGASRAPATGQALRVLTFKASPRQIGIVGGGFFDFVARIECPSFDRLPHAGWGRGCKGDGDLQQLSFLTVSSSLQFLRRFYPRYA